jgi:hypothetical protein
LILCPLFILFGSWLTNRLSSSTQRRFRRWRLQFLQRFRGIAKAPGRQQREAEKGAGSLCTTCSRLWYAPTPSSQHDLLINFSTSLLELQERECKEEQAELDRREREEGKNAERIASAYNRAFQLGRDGKGSEMRNVIEEFNLDVTKPQALNPRKKNSKANGGGDDVRETMLHVAAVHCDVVTVRFLVGKGKAVLPFTTSFFVQQPNFVHIQARTWLPSMHPI